LWIVAGALEGWDATSVTGVSRRVAELLAAALHAEDAEASGVHAQELLADPCRAVELLGAPDVPLAVRHAVVQRFGGVGALLVIACEESWQLLHAARVSGETTSTERLDPLHANLEELLHRFADIGPQDMDCLVEAIERAEGWSPGSEAATAHRRLHVTYAVAARDGTDEAHRAYVQALDGVLALKRGLVST
jgi:hypothetical protein